MPRLFCVIAQADGKSDSVCTPATPLRNTQSLAANSHHGHPSADHWGRCPGCLGYRPGRRKSDSLRTATPLRNTQSLAADSPSRSPVGRLTVRVAQVVLCRRPGRWEVRLGVYPRRLFGNTQSLAADSSSRSPVGRSLYAVPRLFCVVAHRPTETLTWCIPATPLR